MCEIVDSVQVISVQYVILRTLIQNQIRELKKHMDLKKVYDLFIIGGGINGCGVAADAAGRGLSVYLAEQNDLASGTSSASSKLIHGGLRYLEHYEFRLVKEALAEREVLLSKAPHLVSPLKFTLPHRPHLRPSWMIRTGLFMYDHLSKRNSLPSAKSVPLGMAAGLKPDIQKGFEYYDCWVDDARLVINNAIDAAERSATIETGVRCESANYVEEKQQWVVTCKNLDTGHSFNVIAKHIINAAGPWMRRVIDKGVPQLKASRGIRLIKGSHIIVPRVPNGDSAYILQNEDRRIVFVLPYLNDYSVIGTTDKEYTGPLDEIKIDDDEIKYLISVHNQHFLHELKASDIVATYSGVRPLCDDESNDPSAITRDYTIDTQALGNNAFISIYGGKITTYRKLANAVLEELRTFEPKLRKDWTKATPLPGCAFFGETREEIKTSLRERFPWLGNDLVKRYASSYGHLCERFLGDFTSLNDLGKDFGHGLTEQEVNYLIESEWARTADDILFRRTKVGYHYNDNQIQALEAYISNRLDEEAKPNHPLETVI